MSKRDTIIIAVLLNVGLLAVLFLFATNTSEDKVNDSSEIKYTLEDATLPSSMPAAQSSLNKTPSLISTQTAPRDEVDEALSSYANTNSSSMTPTEVSLSNTYGEEIPVQAPVQASVQSPAPVNSPSLKPLEASTAAPAPTYTEVTVKKGDALEKIARANGTTTEEIKKINHLTSEKLSIGQVLKVPANKTAKPAKTASTTTSAPKASSNSDIAYYVIKSGDNPWKIARQFKVKYEDILRLNNLNEEKARNLKVGDKIRVK